MVNAVVETIRSSQQCMIAHFNLHSVYLWHHDEKMRACYEQAQYVYIDGMALIWLGKLMGYPLRLEHRPTCIEYMRPVLAEAARQGWRVFYLQRIAVMLTPLPCFSDIHT
jgi:N-acetylglucosaminyldiphosphoundecaprenol N-acetyl-beta-D-mannosaminyltransferase